VQFALSKRSRALIADEMGLGKTRTAITVAAHNAALWPVLVLCPSSLRLTWKDELLEALFGVLEEEDGAC
jgi:SWI/SNF-related matrix-associated actin-dependent regulator of chromatin subfamily A-like protein 1